jgi:hypothetical protein
LAVPAPEGTPISYRDYGQNHFHFHFHFHLPPHQASPYIANPLAQHLFSRHPRSQIAHESPAEYPLAHHGNLLLRPSSLSTTRHHRDFRSRHRRLDHLSPSIPQRLALRPRHRRHPLHSPRPHARRCCTRLLVQTGAARQERPAAATRQPETPRGAVEGEGGQPEEATLGER